MRATRTRTIVSITPQIAALVPSPAARVLDYGSGEALHADRVAAVAGELLLCEAAPRVRAGIAERFAGNAKIRAVTPEEVQRLPEHSLDLIVLHSVAQYLDPQEAGTLFALFRRLVKPDGVLLVSDVIPSDVAALTDVWELLRFAAANGFLIAALVGLVRNILSSYWQLRTRLGLTRYSEADMLAKLATAGFSAHRLSKNIGHHYARMAFIAAAGRFQSVKLKYPVLTSGIDQQRWLAYAAVICSRKQSELRQLANTDLRRPRRYCTNLIMIEAGIPLPVDMLSLRK